MELQQLQGEFVVCKLPSAEHVDLRRAFTFLSVTEDEISLVCEASRLPKHVTEVEYGWRALKISGILDFSLVGIIAKISGLLAAQEICIFVISTFNTDYILLKDKQYAKALDALRAGGYTIV